MTSFPLRWNREDRPRSTLRYVRDADRTSGWRSWRARSDGSCTPKMTPLCCTQSGRKETTTQCSRLILKHLMVLSTPPRCWRRGFDVYWRPVRALHGFRDALGLFCRPRAGPVRASQACLVRDTSIHGLRAYRQNISDYRTGARRLFGFAFVARSVRCFQGPDADYTQVPSLRLDGSRSTLRFA